MAVFLADYRWIGPHGIGRFARELRDRLPALHPLPRCWPLLHPLDPLILSGMLCWLRPQVRRTTCSPTRPERRRRKPLLSPRRLRRERKLRDR